MWHGLNDRSVDLEPKYIQTLVCYKSNGSVLGSMFAFNKFCLFDFK